MRPVNFLPAVAASLACIALASCGSSNTPPPAVTPDVYVSGFHGDYAAYWKNGTEVDLSDGTTPSVASGIAVNGGNVIAVGYDLTAQGTNQAYIWNNGVQTTLNDNGLQTQAYGVALSGSDVYVAGRSFDPNGTPQQYPVLWKNGTPTRLTGNNGGSAAYSVAIAGSDVYVAGVQFITTQISPNNVFTTQQAVVWKNGVITTLTAGANPAAAEAIAVSGSDVYVAGYQSPAETYSLPYYWKNGTAIQLSNTAQGAIAAGVAVANGDVWVTSQSATFQPIAYLNGVAQTLSETEIPAAPYGTTAYGTDFYSAGTATNAQNTGLAVAWMNDTLIFSAPDNGATQSAGFAIAVTAPPSD